MAVLLAGMLASAPSGVHAQEFGRNAWGVYAAPTIYGYSEGSDYQEATTGGGLDLGLYYSRFFTRGFSARLEARYEHRGMDDVVQNEIFPAAYFPIRVAETVLEIPLVLQADRRVLVADHELRLSTGAGVSYKFVLDQELLQPDGEITALVAADSYQRFALLLDGGVTFAVAPRDGIFARIRLDVDISTMGEPADADVIRRFWSTGLYAGYELGF